MRHASPSMRQASSTHPAEPDSKAFPGLAYFGAGANNKHVTRLGPYCALGRFRGDSAFRPWLLSI
ncbi:hypothetical protein ACWEWQ_40350, partial [Streptomyces sp. NPDC003832]